MAEQFANHYGTTLAASIDATRPVTLTLSSNANVPNTPEFRLLLGVGQTGEILLITAVNGGASYTGTNVEGTSAQSWPLGTAANVVLTAGAIDQLELDAIAGGASQWHLVTVPFTDVQIGALTKAVNLMTLTAKQIVCGIVEKHSVAFVGGAISEMIVTVGDSNGTPTTYAATPFDVFQAPGDTIFYSNNVLGMASFAGGVIQANFTATGANLSALTAGSIDFYLAVLTLP